MLKKKHNNLGTFMKIKILIVALFSLTLTGCGMISRLTAHYTGYSLICVKETGVEYIQFSRLCMSKVISCCSNSNTCVHLIRHIINDRMYKIRQITLDCQ